MQKKMAESVGKKPPAVPTLNKLALNIIDRTNTGKEDIAFIMKCMIQIKAFVCLLLYNSWKGKLMNDIHISSDSFMGKIRLLRNF